MPSIADAFFRELCLHRPLEAAPTSPRLNHENLVILYTYENVARLVLALSLTLAACAPCQPAPSSVARSMPELRMASFPFVTYDELGGEDFAWRQGVEALKLELPVPAALETKLAVEQRQTWRQVLDALERYHQLSESTWLLATSPRAQVQCAIDAHWRHPHAWSLAAHQLVQQHRNVLWALGRLELGARSFILSLEQLREAFRADRLQHADEPLLSPLDAHRSRFETLDSAERRLDGDWLHAKMLPRFARHRPAYPLMLHLQEALLDWQQRTEVDARWSYAASAVLAPRRAVDAWLLEHAALLEAVAEYGAQSRVLERLVSAPEGQSPSEACVAARVRAVSRAASTLDQCLRMQVELQLAQAGMRTLISELGSDDSGSGLLLADINTMQLAIDQRMAQILALEKAALLRWDDANLLLWNVFSEVLDAEGHAVLTVVEDRLAWRALFFAQRSPLPRLQPEPERLSKRGKRLTPFVSEVLDPLRSPARIAEVEQVLLAISEIDATLERMHQSISNACGSDRCQAVPSPIVDDSPRDSAWVTQWRSTPVAQRSLGHNLVVLELCRLHVARQVQRLAAMHAWFAELSSASLEWPKLASWQRTWVLYAHRLGSYLGLLRAMAQLAQQVEDFSRSTQPLRSPALQALLEQQHLLVGLSIDYARFVDRDGEAPIPIDTLLSTWSKLQEQLLSIETLTLERDQLDTTN